MDPPTQSVPSIDWNSFGVVQRQRIRSHPPTHFVIMPTYPNQTRPTIITAAATNRLPSATPQQQQSPIPVNVQQWFQCQPPPFHMRSATSIALPSLASFKIKGKSITTFNQIIFLRFFGGREGIGAFHRFDIKRIENNSSLCRNDYFIETLFPTNFVPHIVRQQKQTLLSIDIWECGIWRWQVVKESECEWSDAILRRSWIEKALNATSHQCKWKLSNDVVPCN